MGVIERAPRENSIGEKRLKRQKVAKKPVAKAIPVVERPKEAKKTGEPPPTTGRPEKARKLEEARELGGSKRNMGVSTGSKRT